MNRNACGRNRIVSLVALLALIPLAGRLAAQAPPPSFGGQYPFGVEGIKAGSVPPPGIYLRDYNLFYYSNDFPDGPSNFRVFTYVNAPRPIWITGLKFLGADYGADMILPIGHVDLRAGPFEDKEFSVGDLAIEPIILGWHLKQFDISAGYAFWIPTGGFNEKHPARLSKGFWDNMFTAGGTWYPDEAKTWAASILGRYEIPMEHPDFDVTPGHVLTLEWGFSKTFQKTIDVGFIGYYQQQLSKDHGSGASNQRNHVVGIGPEASVMFPKLGLITSLRYVNELDSNDQSRGHTFTLTLTKIF